MAIVYINKHFNNGYSTAILIGYCDLRFYVKGTEWLLWVRNTKKRPEIMIKDTDKNPQRLTDFIAYCKSLGCTTYVRNQRGEDWEEV